MPEFICLPVEDTVLTGMGLTGGATAHAVLAVNDADTTHTARSSLTGNGEIRLRMEALPAVASIQGVEFRLGAQQTSPVGAVPSLIKPYVYIGTTKHYGADIDPSAGAYNDEVVAWAFNPATTLPWEKSELEAAQFGFECPRDEGEFDNLQKLTYAWLAVEAIPADPGKSREKASVLLNVLRHPVESVGVKVGPEALDNNNMDDLSLWHLFHPITEVLGRTDRRGIRRTGVDGWRSLLVQQRELRYNLQTHVGTLTLRRRRGELVTVYDGGQSRVSSASIENGVPFISNGAEKFYTRNSVAWGRDPVTGLVVPFERNERPLTGDPDDVTIGGFTPENYAVQYVQNSAFVSLTGITHTGSGSHALQANPPNPLFREDVTPNALKMTAGSPHSTDGIEEWSISIPDPNLLLRFSIEHQDPSGGPIHWSYQRLDSGFYWDDTNGLFAAGPMGGTWNAITERTTRFRDRSAFIIAGGAAHSGTLRVRQPSGGTSARENLIYHVQLEHNGFGIVSSWIASTAGALAREIQNFGFTDNAGARSFPGGAGTAFFEVMPFWNAAEMASGFPTVVELEHDASNSVKLFYNGPAGTRLDFAFEAAAFVANATVPWNPVLFTTYVLAIRWLPVNEAAFGLEPGTVSVFLDGVKGTDAVRSANMTKVASANMYIGTNPTGTAFNGVVRRTKFKPEILSDDEIARLSATRRW